MQGKVIAKTYYGASSIGFFSTWHHRSDRLLYAKRWVACVAYAPAEARPRGCAGGNPLLGSQQMWYGDRMPRLGYPARRTSVPHRRGFIAYRGEDASVESDNNQVGVVEAMVVPWWPTRPPSLLLSILHLHDLLKLALLHNRDLVSV